MLAIFRTRKKVIYNVPNHGLCAIKKKYYRYSCYKLNLQAIRPNNN